LGGDAVDFFFVFSFIWFEMPLKTKPVNSYYYVSRKDFQDFICRSRQPLLVKNIDIGPCVKKWTVDYLSSTVGSLEVKVHVSPGGQMSFVDKNFKYKTLPFRTFLQRAAQDRQAEWFIAEDEKYYLRSIGFDRRGKNIADLKKDFPQIGEDISFPDLFENESYFSSVFRIASAGVQVWTHYDVMDNLLMQVSGRKRVVLYKPEDAKYMYLEGDKSRVLDIDDPDPNLFPEFHKATRYECILEPGDAIYIPALWFHNTLSYTFGIGVNVFWKHLKSDLYDKSDVYGNKDVLPASKALELVRKAKGLLKTLPPDHRDFYVQRAIIELESLSCQ